ncbi:hypothetical protein BURCENBC7_AP3131 [Burkholderia cenocepacia BC7]|nr:hypothetical protein BURCENBC7_AP3131 [Burkholderia cenocepacia BC7]
MMRGAACTVRARGTGTVLARRLRDNPSPCGASHAPAE